MTARMEIDVEAVGIYAHGLLRAYLENGLDLYFLLHDPRVVEELEGMGVLPIPLMGPEEAIKFARWVRANRGYLRAIAFRVGLQASEADLEEWAENVLSIF